MTQRIALAILGALAVMAVAAPAQAAGCNGVVDFFRWGCAPWDNNNGPQFPYYRKKVVTMHAPAGSRIETRNGQQMISINGQNYPVSGVVSAGGGNVVSAGGANVVAAGGMNLQVVVQN